MDYCVVQVSLNFSNFMCHVVEMFILSRITMTILLLGTHQIFRIETT